MKKSDEELYYYFKEIEDIPILKAEEEFYIAKQAQNGDVEAQGKLVKHNLKLVALKAQKYNNDNVSYEDLIQEGNMGLIRASKDFNPDLGTRFTTYANAWIKSYMLKFLLKNNNVLTLTNKKMNMLIKYKKIKQELQKNLSVKIDYKTVADVLQITHEEALELEILSMSTININTPYTSMDDEGMTLESILPSRTPSGDLILTDNEALQKIEIDELKEIICKILKKKERIVLIYRYGLFGQNTYSIKEIAEILGCTPKYVGILEKKGLNKLNKYFKIDNYLTPKRKIASPNRGIKNSIYDYFKDYPQHEVDKCLNRLKEEERSIVARKYDISVYITAEEYSKFYFSIIPKIRKMLQKTNYMTQNELKCERLLMEEMAPKKKVLIDKTKLKYHTIYEIFPESSETEIINAVSLLSNREQEVIKMRFGENLDCIEIKCAYTSDINKEFHNAIKRLTRILKNKSLPRELKSSKNDFALKIKNDVGLNLKTKTIYDYFESYDIDEVNIAISKLPEKEKKIILLRYGPDLLNPSECFDYSEDDHHDFYACVLPKLKKVLRNPEYVFKAESKKSVYDYLGEYSYEKLCQCIDRLNSEDLSILNECFDEKLMPKYDYTGTLNSFHLKVLPKLRKMLQNPNYITREEHKLNQSGSDLERIESYVDLTLCYDLLRDMDKKELEIIKLKFGIGQNHFFTIDEISNHTKVSKKDIRLILKHFLSNYKAVLLENKANELSKKHFQKM